LVTPGKKEVEEMSKKKQAKKCSGSIRGKGSMAEQREKKSPFNPFPNIEKMEKALKLGPLKGPISHVSFFISADLLKRHTMVLGRENTGKTYFKKIAGDHLLHSPDAKD
jgi:hypothetical protein